MKRYRGKNANYQRLGSAFIPSHKWGKRIKRRLKEATRGETAIVRDPITPANYNEVAALIESLWSPATPTITANTSKPRQWLWTGTKGTKYTTITGPDGAEYIISLDAAVKWAQPPEVKPSLEFTLPDVKDPKPQ